MELQRYKLKDPVNTGRFCCEVFGGESFLEFFPDLMTDKGIDLHRHTSGFGNDNYYVVVNGRPADKVHSFDASTCFFSEEEMVFLEPVVDSHV